MTAKAKKLGEGPRAPRLYLLMTRELCAGDPAWTLREAIRGGVDMVQLREKPFTSADAAWIRQAAAICAEDGVPCIINDAIDLVAQGDGVHLGQEDLEAQKAGSLRDRDFLLGISTHSLEEIERAELEEPDYIGIGPCFPTATKGYDRGLSKDALVTLLARAASLPVYAIGGITCSNLPQLLEHGVLRIAVSSAILCAADPRRASRDLRALLDAEHDPSAASNSSSD